MAKEKRYLKEYKQKLEDAVTRLTAAVNEAVAHENPVQRLDAMAETKKQMQYTQAKLWSEAYTRDNKRANFGSKTGALTFMGGIVGAVGISAATGGSVILAAMPYVLGGGAANFAALSVLFQRQGKKQKTKMLQELETLTEEFAKLKTTLEENTAHTLDEIAGDHALKFSDAFKTVLTRNNHLTSAFMDACAKKEAALTAPKNTPANKGFNL